MCVWVEKMCVGGEDECVWKGGKGVHAGGEDECEGRVCVEREGECVGG